MFVYPWDINDDRLKRVKQIFSIGKVENNEVEFHFVNTNNLENSVESLMDVARNPEFDDIFCYAPVILEITKLQDKEVC